ncbi:hypothetical protein AB0J38_26130 [Streptomyces sp. NPDC050095]|uniref:hypothetical protein n=1 Tax=unclassified Streptomyces TaxID=2593676 RepID=UPI00343E58F2
MTPAERRALLGDAVIAHIEEVVTQAPEPTPEVIESLRRIFTRPLAPAPAPALPAAKAA